jgi:hypothetical protein
MDPSEIDTAIEDLELRVERLRSLYSQFFSGIEKSAPMVVRKDVDRRIWALRKVQLRNTAKKFKLQMLIQRYNTLSQFWSRTMREIEAGRYKPHLQKAERRMGVQAEIALKTGRISEPNETGESEEHKRQKAEDARRQLERELEASLDDPFDMPGASASASAAPGASHQDGTAATIPGLAAAKGEVKAGSDARSDAERIATEIAEAAASRDRSVTPHPSTVLASGTRIATAAGGSFRAGQSNPFADPARKPAASLTKDRMSELHADLNRARRSLKATKDVSLGALEKQLTKQVEKLKAKHPGRNVDFSVVVRDGKAVLRPKLK